MDKTQAQVDESSKLTSYFSLYDEISYPVHIIDVDFTLLYFNKASSSMFGLSTNNLQKPCFEAFNKKSPCPDCPLIAEEAGHLPPLICQLNTNYYEIKVNRIKIDDSQYYCEHFCEITNTEKEYSANDNNISEGLKLQLEFYKNFIEIIPYPLFYKDTDGVYQICNEAFARFNGKPKKDFIGHTVHESVKDKNLANIYHHADLELMKSKGSQVYKSKVRNGMGEEKDVIFNKIACVDKNGQLKGLLGFIIDITEQERIEGLMRKQNIELEKARMEIKTHLTQIKVKHNELKEAYDELKSAKKALEYKEARLNDIFNAAENVAFIMTDIQDNNIDILEFSPGAERLFGYKVSEVLGKDFLVLLPENDRYPYKKNLLASISEGKKLSEEITLLKKNNETFFGLKTTYPLISAKGNVSAIIDVIIDISEQKNAIKDLEAAKNKAEESDKLKSAFLMNISHEIRTPMNAIIGFTRLINDPSIAQAEKQYFSQIIQKSADQLLHIIDDIIDISQIEAGQMTLREKSCNINKLLKDIKLYFEKEQENLNKQYIQFSLECGLEDEKAKTVTDELRLRQILSNLINNAFKFTHRLQFSLECGLEDEKAKTVTDELRLRQILSNLINNAFKFTEEGKITFGYTLTNKNKLEFFVHDTGIGIDETQNKIIFDHFHKLENKKQIVGGVGLGLSISYGLVHLLGGEIWCKSTPGKGSSFYFRIQYNNSNVRETKKSQNIQVQNCFQGKKILVVEDNHFNFTYIQAALKPTEAQLQHVETGEEAVEQCRQNKYDVILMDIRLPGIDGYEAIKQIKSISPEIPVIAQTAYAMTKDKIFALENGCTDYIAKPIDKFKLIKKIGKCLACGK